MAKKPNSGGRVENRVEDTPPPRRPSTERKGGTRANVPGEGKAPSRPPPPPSRESTEAAPPPDQ
jgi:hypothetical protein